MKKEFVQFFSPGTFVDEESQVEIRSWDLNEVFVLARSIKERHGARPYGFRFVTRERGPNDLDSKETKRSNMYYLGGTVKTLEEVKAENNPNNRILIANMEGNGFNRIIVNTNSYKITKPLYDGDIVLQWK